MTTLQKWMLVIAGVVVSVAVAYYLLVFIPTNKKAEIRRKAGIECQKRIKEAVEVLPEPQTQEQTKSQAELIIQLNSAEGFSRCIENVLGEWGNN